MIVENSCFGSERYDDGMMDEYLQASLEDGRTPLLVAFENAAADKKGDPAGYVLGEMEDDRTGHIVSVAVMENLRDRHLGGLLVDRVCASLRQAGAQRIRLEVRKENAAAIHLYEKRGFSRTDDLPDYYGPGEDGIEMTLEYGPTPG
ncbi:MAG TPA: N-acetyltransferase [Patescibacteria group bacterium]|nr:N-acetyltransferase [Patescibacteria group bacterium]